MSDISADPGNPQRWWEGYLVRYFLGFIVGVICVVTLGIQMTLGHASSSGSEISILTENQFPKISELSFAPIAIIFAFLGFAYCYIASSPITVLHSTRMMTTWFHRHSRSFWMAWALTLALHFVFHPLYEKYTWSSLLFWVGLVVAVILLARSPKIFNSTSLVDRIKGPHLLFNVVVGSVAILSCLAIARSFAPINTSLAAFSLPVLWILFGQYWTLSALLRDDNAKFFEFYKNISKARQKTGSRDIRDTYTHLREHANSVFVVLIELCILAGLLVLRQLQPELIHPADPMEFEIAYWNSVLILTGVWLVPTVFMWSLANRLEKKFSDESDDFIKPATPP